MPKAKPVFRDRRRQTFYQICTAWFADKTSPLYSNGRPWSSFDFTRAFWNGFHGRRITETAEDLDRNLNFVAWRAGADCAAEKHI